MCVHTQLELTWFTTFSSILANKFFFTMTDFFNLILLMFTALRNNIGRNYSLFSCLEVHSMSTSVLSLLKKLTLWVVKSIFSFVNFLGAGNSNKNIYTRSQFSLWLDIPELFQLYTQHNEVSHTVKHSCIYFANILILRNNRPISMYKKWAFWFKK